MFEENTFEVILKRMMDNVSEKFDKREGSIIYDTLAPVSIELINFYISLSAFMNECFADTASRDYLILRAKERGLEPYPATGAVLRGIFEPATIDVEGKRFNLGSLNYVAGSLLEDGTREVYCETPGENGNRQLGKMTPIEYIDGLERAELIEVIVYGEGEEDTEAFRQRYFDSLNTQAFGGNVADYKQKVKALNGVGQVRVYSADEWNGGGTVKVVITTSENSQPSHELISTIQNELDPTENTGKGMGIAPVGHIVTVAGVNEESIDVTMILELVDGYTIDLVKPFVENAINDYFDSINATWEEIYNSGQECIKIPVAVMAGQISNVMGVANITLLDVEGYVFGSTFELEKDCICTLGDLVLTEVVNNV